MRDQGKKRKLGPESADDGHATEQVREPKHTYAKATNLSDSRFNEVAVQAPMGAWDQRTYFNSTIEDAL